MSQSKITTANSPTAMPGCDAASRTTRSLLGYGVIAGPFYVTIALAQAFTCEGFDLTRHQWSMLANGGPGWIQIANFVLTGLMVIAFAVGLERVWQARRGSIAVSDGAWRLRRRRPDGALDAGRGAGWAPRLIAVYGAGLVAAGVFRADPALGFPVGTPNGPGAVFWHGLLHLAAGGVGFTALAIACIVMARRYAAEGSRGWAAFSVGTGLVLLTGFAMIASSGGSALGTILFTTAVLLVWTWMSAVAVNRYRRV